MKSPKRPITEDNLDFVPSKAPEDFGRNKSSKTSGFVYSVPENYSPTRRILKEKKEELKGYVEELEVRLGKLKDTSWDSIDKLMRGICKKYSITPKVLHNEFKLKHGMIPDQWVSKDKKKEEVKEERKKSPMELLADQVASMGEKPQKLDEDFLQSVEESKILQLEKQVYDLRNMLLEVTQGTIVHNLGAGSPGSGEVRINRMDDVNIPATINDGESLVWDATNKEWITSSASAIVRGAPTDLATMGLAIYELTEKVNSNDERIEKLLGSGLVELEENTAGIDPTVRPTFIDEIPLGDVNRYTVTLDPERKVYALDGVPQPTVQLPRGDILEFDITGLPNPERFEIALSYNKPLTQGVDVSNGVVTLDTTKVDSEIVRLYYRDNQVSGIGWIITITDN